MRQRRRTRWRESWPLAVVLLVPTTPVMGAWLGGAFTFLTPLFMFAVVPLLDVLGGVWRLNPLPERAAALEADDRFTYALYAGAIINVSVFAFGGAWCAPPGHPLIDRLGVTLSVGIITGGMGITLAHELFHRNRPLPRLLGHLNLGLVGYAHYAIEHIAGHHVNVATPRDAVTGRRGESLYTFLGRVVGDEARSAWRIECARLRRRGRSEWSPANRITRLVAIELVFVWGVAKLWGLPGVLYLAAQAAVAVALLETVNYVEHYGLLRREVSPGRYEPVDARHSWDADQRLSNLLLFNLQRHADHHARPNTPYQTLQHLHESPKLPTGYPGMILIAAVPPLWRRVMHPRLDALARAPQPASRAARDAAVST